MLSPILGPPLESTCLYLISTFRHIRPSSTTRHPIPPTTPQRQHHPVEVPSAASPKLPTQSPARLPPPPQRETPTRVILSRASNAVPHFLTCFNCPKIPTARCTQAHHQQPHGPREHSSPCAARVDTASKDTTRLSDAGADAPATTLRSRRA